MLRIWLDKLFKKKPVKNANRQKYFFKEIGAKSTHKESIEVLVDVAEVTLEQNKETFGVGKVLLSGIREDGKGFISFNIMYFEIKKDYNLLESVPINAQISTVVYNKSSNEITHDAHIILEDVLLVDDEIVCHKDIIKKDLIRR